MKVLSRTSSVPPLGLRGKLKVLFKHWRKNSNRICKCKPRVSTARETIFSFSKCSEKIIFPKKSHQNMIFLVSSGKMIFLFPKNMVLFFRRKMKDNLSQKNTWKYDAFFKCSEKMVFPKKIALGYYLSYIMRKDGISFS